jgi:hypothetical protein
MASLILLAISISDVKFEAAKPFPFFSDSPGIRELQGRLSKGDNPSWEMMIRVFIIVLLPVSLILLLFSPHDFKAALLKAIRISAYIASFYYIITRIRLQFFNEATIRRGSALTFGPGAGEIEIKVTTPDLPWWGIFLVILGMLVVLFLCGRRLLWLWLRRRRSVLEEISLIAGEAAQEIKSGMDIRNVILRCYREMSVFLSERSEVKLEEAMTAREFEKRLQEAGVHDEHVHRLTRLFEWVRYGGHEASKREEQEAIRCFEAIARSVQST